MCISIDLTIHKSFLLLRMYPVRNRTQISRVKKNNKNKDIETQEKFKKNVFISLKNKLLNPALY